MISPKPLPQPFIPLNALEVTLEAVGGKALNLARLANAGFSVPNGFFIPTASYQEFVDHNNLTPKIQAALADLDPTSPGDLTAASDEIQTQFKLGAVSRGLVAALEIAYRWLGEPPVAVRSSATAEDLPDMSFAGQQDTFLNVISDGALLEAVVKCWSSLWTARAIGYRARNGISHEDVALSVVVQNMVPSEASGVLFTANPLTGKRSDIVINATFGLGEALVSGLVEPDHYVVDTSNTTSPGAGAMHLGGATHLHLETKITHKTLGAKASIIRSQSSGGTSTDHAAPGSGYAQRQAVPNEVILQLAKIGQEIEALYGFPQDIEWAYLPSPPVPSRSISEGMLPEREEGLYILQSRPITSLYPLPKNLPMEPLKFMIGLHVVQGILEPYTPLGQDVIRLVLTGGGRVFGLDHTLESQTAFYTAAERVWINMTPIVRTPLGHKFYPKVIKSIDPGVAHAAAKIVQDPRLAPVKSRLRFGTIRRFAGFGLPIIGHIIQILRDPERRRDEVLQAFDDRVTETQEQQISSGDMWVDFSRRVKLVHQAKDIFPDFVIPKGIPPIVAGMAPFFGILERFANEAAENTGDPRFKTIHLEIARGIPHNVTTEMDLILWQTAQTIKNDLDSYDDFNESAASELAARYFEGYLPAVAQTAVTGFLEQYGARGLGEIDIGRIRWREDPTHVIQVLQSYLQIDDPEMAPDAVFARGAKSAEAAAEELIAAVRKLPGGRIKSRLVRFAVKRYRTVGGMREAPKFFIIRMMGIIRQGLLESGRDLAAAGLLERADDLFFLRISELDVLSEGAGEPGSSSLSGMLRECEGEKWAAIREKIRERRATREREMRRVQIPRVLMSDGTAYYEGVAAPEGDSDVIIGDPVSPGVVEGNVRVILNPIGTQLEPGEILVCPGTDPAWTPLFLAAGGLVMEVGGMMTHGSVVAREYGIPAVVGVDRATTRLKTGERVRVDGSTGVVEVIGDQ